MWFRLIFTIIVITSLFTNLQAKELTKYSITFQSEIAEYNNILGSYEKDEDGKPIKAQIILPYSKNFTNSKDAVFETKSGSINLFLIADGFRTFGNLHGKEIKFNNREKFPELLINNTRAKESKNFKGVFFSDTSLNFDEIEHFRYTLKDNNKTIIIEIEDLKDGGDLTYDDLIVTLELIEESDKTLQIDPFNGKINITTQKQLEELATKDKLFLSEAVLKTLEMHPEIKEKRVFSNITKNEKLLAQKEYYPTINIVAGIGESSDDSKSTTSSALNSVGKSEITISASLNLFNGFATKYAIEGKKRAIEGNNYSINEYENYIAILLTESYLNLLKQKEILQLSQENIEIYKEHRKKIKTKVTSGFARASELEFITSKLRLAQIGHIGEENMFLQSKINFETYYGFSVNENALLFPRFTKSLPTSLELIAQEAYETNPSINAMEKNIESLQNSYKQSQYYKYPSIDVEVSKSYIDEDSGIDYQSQDSEAMLFLSYTLYDGGAQKLASETGLLSLKQQQELLKAKKREILRVLSTSWINYQKLHEQLLILDELKNYSRNTRDAYNEEFTIGKRSYIDLLNAENDYFNAQKSYINTKYTFELYKYRLLEVLGGLTDYFKGKTNSGNYKDLEFSIESGLDKKIGKLSLETKEKRRKKEQEEFFLTE